VSSGPILNLSAYKFVPLAALPQLREQVQQQALAQGLKGTVLLAEEGINLVLAGLEQPLRAVLTWLRGQAGLHDLQAKESWSRTVPFRHLRVKVKREIIRMNHPAIQPAAGRAASVDAATLARWLATGHDDTGRPVATLDTRNAFEVGHGRFRGAIDWRIEKFSDFPAAAQAHRGQLAGKTVVSYCTGGIRCEKAALVLREMGLESVYQLDGGILKYLETAPGAPHWEGACFVFDGREALDERLEPAAGLPGAHQKQNR
jgi:UPF0176 protein